VADRRVHRLGEGDVLVDGLHLQDPGLAVGSGVQLAYEAIVIQDRQREVSPPALGDGLVNLQVVLYSKSSTARLRS
jgi:hypothetical protein